MSADRSCAGHGNFPDVFDVCDEKVSEQEFRVRITYRRSGLSRQGPPMRGKKAAEAEACALMVEALGIRRGTE